MKRKLIIAFIGTVLVVFGGGLTGFCGDVATKNAVAPSDGYDVDFGHYTDSMEPNLVYATFIANYLNRCDCKARLLNAKSPNIRKDAFRDTLKGAYVRENQAALVRYMLANNVALNPRRMEYVINQRFAEQVNPQAVYALLAKEPINE